MGRSQTDKTQKSLQAERELTSQDNVQPVDKRLQQRQRRYKSNIPSTKLNTSQLSTHEKSDAKPHILAAAVDRRELKVQQDPQYSRHREQKRTGPRRIRRVPVPHLSPLPESRPDSPEGHTPNPENVKLSEHRDDGLDSDLSESERLPVPPFLCAPPQLNLRAEVIDPNDFPSQKTGHRGQYHSSFSFPDSLPPPFNLWNLGQLALFYNMEGRGPPHPRSVGPLEKYLDRLLQLEWHQFQTVQEEGGQSRALVLAGSHNRPHASLSTRLSCPKSILQCQCAFPLVFLSSLDSNAAQLSGCSCAACRTHYTSCCRSHRQSRLGLPQEPRSSDSHPPKRSYSESHTRSCDKSAVSSSRAQRLGSPVRRNSHLKRMQALGNIRNPVQSHTTSNPQCVVKDSSVGTELGCNGGDDATKDHRRVSVRRSCSEQRRGGSDGRRSGSECRRGRSSERKRSGSEQRRAAVSERQELKPEVIGAMVNHLLGSKSKTVDKPNGRLKRVEFITK